MSYTQVLLKPPIEHIDFGPKKCFHSYLYIGNTENLSIKHNFDQSLEIRCRYFLTKNHKTVLFCLVCFPSFFSQQKLHIVVDRILPQSSLILTGYCPNLRGGLTYCSWRWPFAFQHESCQLEKFKDERLSLAQQQQH